MKVIGTDKNGDEIAEVSVTELDTMFKEIKAKVIDEFVEKAYFILGCEDSDIYCKETIKESNLTTKTIAKESIRK